MIWPIGGPTKAPQIFRPVWQIVPSPSTIPGAVIDISIYCSSPSGLPLTFFSSGNSIAPTTVSSDGKLLVPSNATSSIVNNVIITASDGNGGLADCIPFTLQVSAFIWGTLPNPVTFIQTGSFNISTFVTGAPSPTFSIAPGSSLNASALATLGITFSSAGIFTAASNANTSLLSGIKVRATSGSLFSDSPAFNIQVTVANVVTWKTALNTITLNTVTPTYDLHQDIQTGTPYPPWTANPATPLNTNVLLDAATGILSAVNPSAVTSTTNSFGVNDVDQTTYPQILLTTPETLFGDHVSRRFYNRRIKRKWVNCGGDYIDVNGNTQTVALNTAISSTVNVPPWVTQYQRKNILDMTTLVRNWTNGTWFNSGVFIRVTGSIPICAKSMPPQGGNNVHPLLDITFSDGTPPVSLEIVADAIFTGNPDTTVFSDQDLDPFSQASGQVQLTNSSNWVVRWDFSSLPSTNIATANLSACKFSSANFPFSGTLTLYSYRVDIPYKPVVEPMTTGIAQNYLLDNGIENDPNVIFVMGPRFPSLPPTGTSGITSAWGKEGIDDGGTVNNTPLGGWSATNFIDRTWSGTNSSAQTNIRICKISDVTDQINVKPPPGGDLNSMVLENCFGAMNTATGHRIGGGESDNIWIGNDFAVQNASALDFRQTKLLAGDVLTSFHKVGGVETLTNGVGDAKHLFARWQEFYLVTDKTFQNDGMKGWGFGVKVGQSPYSEYNRPYAEGASGDRPTGFDSRDGKGGWSQRTERWFNIWDANSQQFTFSLDNPASDRYYRNMYFYHMDMSRNYYHDPLTDEEWTYWDRNGGFYWQRLQWVDIETEVQVNTVFEVVPGSGLYDANFDGILRAWANGRLVFEATDCRMTKDPHLGISNFWLQAFWGGAANEPFGPFSVLYRKLVLAKVRIGPVRVI